MGKKDISGKALIGHEDVFADIYNVLVFECDRLMEGQLLKNMNAGSWYSAADTAELRGQERDCLKKWEISGENGILTGIELQTEPDSEMPFRCASYDGADYRSQRSYRKVKGRRVRGKVRYPIVTIVLYFGRQKWECPLNIKDYFNADGIPVKNGERIESFINDYYVHMFDICRLKPETISMFTSDFRLVADYFVNSMNNPGYVPDAAKIVHLDEFLNFMSAVTGDDRYNSVIDLLSEKDRKEGVNMCQVLDYRENRGRMRGREEGKAEGKAEGILSEKIDTIKFLVGQLNYSLEKACEMRNISVEEYTRLTCRNV